MTAEMVSFRIEFYSAIYSAAVLLVLFFLLFVSLQWRRQRSSTLSRAMPNKGRRRSDDLSSNNLQANIITEQNRIVAQLLPPHIHSNPPGKVPLSEISDPNSDTRDLSSLTIGVTTTAAPSIEPEGPIVILPRAVRQVIELLQSPDWVLQQKSKDGSVLFSDKRVSWSATKACLFSSTLPTGVNLEDVQKVLQEAPSDTTPERSLYAFRYDSLLDGFRVVKKMDKATSVIHTLYKTPMFGIACRDMVTTTTDYTLTPKETLAYFKEEAEEVFVQASVDAAEVVPSTYGYVRGTVHLFGVVAIAKKCKNVVELHQVMSIDPNGWVPTRAVDATNYEQMDKMRLLADCIVEASGKKEQS